MAGQVWFDSIVARVFLIAVDNTLRHIANIAPLHFKEHKELTWPLSFSDFSLIKHMENVLDKQAQSMEAPPRTIQD